jgi:hypothetical protein
MTNIEKRHAPWLSFIRASSLIRHSLFVVRHFHEQGHEHE